MLPKQSLLLYICTLVQLQDTSRLSILHLYASSLSPPNRFASKPGTLLRAQGKAQSHPLQALQARPPFAQLLHSKVRSHPNLTKSPSPDLPESETRDLHSVLSKSERRNLRSLVSMSERRKLHSLLSGPSSQGSRGSTPARLLCSVWVPSNIPSAFYSPVFTQMQVC